MKDLFPVTNDIAEKCVIAYQEERLGQEAILKLFDHMARAVWESISPEDASEEVIRDATLLCLDKTARFDAQRNKAFNFFTTIIAGHFRQVRHANV